MQQTKEFDIKLTFYIFNYHLASGRQEQLQLAIGPLATEPNVANVADIHNKNIHVNTYQSAVVAVVIVARNCWQYVVVLLMQRTIGNKCLYLTCNACQSKKETINWWILQKSLKPMQQINEICNNVRPNAKQQQRH